MGVSRIHLGNDSPLVSKNHINWRLKSIQSMEKIALDTDDLHYTSVVTLSRDDSLKIRLLLIDMMEKFNAIVRDSPEEIGQCLVVDLFSF